MILDFDNDADLIENRNNVLIEFKTDLFDGVLRVNFTDHIMSQLLLPKNS